MKIGPLHEIDQAAAGFAKIPEELAHAFVKSAAEFVQKADELEVDAGAVAGWMLAQTAATLYPLWESQERRQNGGA